MKKQTRLIYRWHCLKFTIVFYRYRHLFAFFPMNWVYSNVEQKSQQKRMEPYELKTRVGRNLV